MMMRKALNALKSFWRVENIVGTIVALIVLFLVLYPLIMLLYGSMRSVMPGAQGPLHLNNFVEAFGDFSVLKAIKNTFLICFFVTLCSFFIAVPFVWLVTRTNMPGSRIIETLNLIPILLSPFILAIAWATLASPRTGLINVWLHKTLGLPLPIFDIYTPQGIVLCLTIYYVPTIYLFLVAAFRSMDPALEESARVSGATLFGTITRITLPLALPSILASIFIVFVHCAGMFGVPGLLGMPRGFYVLTSKIYTSMGQFPANYNMAATMATLLLAFSIMGVFIQTKILGRRSFVTVTGKGFRPGIIDLGKWKYAAFGISFLYLAIFVFLPLVTLFLVAFSKYWSGEIDASLFTLENFKLVLTEELLLRAIKNTLLVALAGGAVCLFMALVVAYLKLRTRLAFRAFVDFIATIPNAVPGMVIAVGLLWAWVMVPQDVSFAIFGKQFIIPIPVYGTIYILAIGYITRYIPYGLRTISANLISIGNELEESARVCGASWTVMVKQILLPLLAPGLAAGWIFIFIHFVRELDISILLYTEDSIVLPVAVWRLVEDGTYGTSCAMAIIQAVIIFTGLLIFKIFVKGEIVKQT